MANCRSDAASLIKQALTMREVAERYGFEPDRGGYIQCPFHAGDHHGSLKIYQGTGGWHCFGCQAGGSVIDFTMKLFDINFRQALLRLDTDFSLGLYGHQPTKAERSAILEARHREQELKAAIAAEYRVKAAEYRYCFEITKYVPPQLFPDGEIYIHPFYAAAIKRLPALEDWLNENMGR